MGQIEISNKYSTGMGVEHQDKSLDKRCNLQHIITGLTDNKIYKKLSDSTDWESRIPTCRFDDENETPANDSITADMVKDMVGEVVYVGIFDDQKENPRRSGRCSNIEMHAGIIVEIKKANYNKVRQNGVFVVYPEDKSKHDFSVDRFVELSVMYMYFVCVKLVIMFIL